MASPSGSSESSLNAALRIASATRLFLRSLFLLLRENDFSARVRASETEFAAVRMLHNGACRYQLGITWKIISENSGFLTV
ncbi:hypothetical protein KFK09_014305 [Dendrobium nobile]|uniref:Uncharacterized protein n=1 Tax=Dendrobium nobile TaxID=94219 RepID=A0A8T3BBP6_DENNO|nr:hypothetical protein KFK09_014305 [Dendrobium nobile]